jgi:hypothetical protein
MVVSAAEAAERQEEALDDPEGESELVLFNLSFGGF